MTIAKFRNIDLIIFTLLAVIIDFVLGRYGLFGLKMYLSVSVFISLLMIIRWRKWGAITVFALVITHIITYFNNDFLVLLAHSISLLTITFLIIFEPKLRNKTNRYELVSLSYLVIYIIVILVEWSLLQIFGQGISFGNYLVNQSVNFFLGLFILFIIHLQKDLLVDMQTYLIEKSKEKQNEKNNSV